MLALLAALSLDAASRAWAVPSGCDSMCSHQGKDLSCRVRIRWSMEHTTFRDEPNPCGLARKHVLELCPSCAACSPQSLGDDCREAILRRVRNGSANGSQGAAAGALQNSSADDGAGNASVSNLSSANSSEHPANASEGKSSGRRHGNSTSNSSTSSSTNASTSSSTSTHTTGTTTSTTRTSTTNTTSTTITTTTTTSETFCCSAAVDDDDFCGTCWENAPMMSDSYCRESKETCEKCGHKWCNHTKLVKPGCKAYGCIPFTPFNECQCNSECMKYGSCCDDFKDVCEKEDNDDEEEEEVPKEAPGGADAAAGAGAPPPLTSWSDDVLEDAREVVHDMHAKQLGHRGKAKAAHEAKKPARTHGAQQGLSGMSAVPRGVAGLLLEAKARLGATHAWLALPLGLLVSGAVVVARRGWRQWTPVATSQLSEVLPVVPAEE